jgi:hypothetical protein
MHLLYLGGWGVFAHTLPPILSLPLLRAPIFTRHSSELVNYQPSSVLSVETRISIDNDQNTKIHKWS